MAVSIYRGFKIQTSGSDASVWKVRIKNHVLQGDLSSVKKSIDWWCDTSSIIEPKDLANIEQRTQTNQGAETFHGYVIMNDTGDANAWYCMFEGKLIKGAKAAIQRHIETYLVAKQKALLTQLKKK